ncbi:uncharacterized protein [Littorina saxatilis]|uniref:uncharacterized protein n=1 Tax=Littorina saxatilis TaxID=31220 RepID=UPI0038B67438
MAAAALKVWRENWIKLLLLCCSVDVATQDENSGLNARMFEDLPHVVEVTCSGEALASNSDLLTLRLQTSPDDELLVSVNLRKHKCTVSLITFAACHINERDSRRTSLNVLVMDLKDGEERTYGCTAGYEADGWLESKTWTLSVKKNRTTTPSPPSTTTPTTTTIRPQLPINKAPVASGVMGNVQEFQLPISVIIIGLVLLLFFAILCAILVILQCRGRRRRRSRAANRESLLSTKSEPVDQGGYRTTRSMAGYPPGHMPPETPASNFAMRYQKSIPDTGYVSGSSVYYSEPYGTLDDEIKERLRPNPRMCHIPYDLKGNVLETHPQEHSA